MTTRPTAALSRFFKILDTSNKEIQSHYDAFAESANDDQLAQRYKITARSGQTVAGSGRKFLTHIVLHSDRHWAQVAMLLRKEGYATDWQHDFIFSEVFD